MSGIGLLCGDGKMDGGVCHVEGGGAKIMKRHEHIAWIVEGIVIGLIRKPHWPFVSVVDEMFAIRWNGRFTG